MKILIIGASGATGIELTKQALSRHYSVTVLLRSPSTFSITDKNLLIIKGDVSDTKSLAAALDGQDAVLVALGPRGLAKTSVQEDFARNAVNIMGKMGIKRLIDLSAWGAGENNDKMTLVFKVIRYTVLKNVFDDKERGEKIILGSSLDYTMVQPGRLASGPEKGNIAASVNGKNLTQNITRADVAHFMLDQITEKKWLRKSPLLGYKK
jgi:putative NADH-flavin reductase